MGVFCQIHANHRNFSDNHPDYIGFLFRFLQIWSTPTAFRDPKHYPAGDHGGDPIDFTTVTPRSIQGKQRSYRIKMTVKTGGHIHILIYIRVNMCMYIYNIYI